MTPCQPSLSSGVGVSRRRKLHGLHCVFGRRAFVLLAASLLFLPALGRAQCPPPDWFILEGCYGTLTAGDLTLQGTANQPDAGGLTAASFSLHGRLWNVAALAQPNRPPIMSPTSGRTDRNTPLVLTKAKLLSRTSDLDCDVVTIFGVTKSTNNGSVRLGNTTITYTPPTGYSGADRFYLILSDGRGGFLTNSVDVTVTDTGGGSQGVGSAPQLIGTNLHLTFFGTPGELYTVEDKTNLSDPVWLWRTNMTAGTNPPYKGAFVFVEDASNLTTNRFYRAIYPARAGSYPPPTGALPAGMAWVFGGDFYMGDALGDGSSDESPLHTVTLGAFSITTNLVNKTLWDQVYVWALTNGYTFEKAGSAKAATHPVQDITWYDMVKWCNARSEKEGLVPAYYTDPSRTTVYRTGQYEVQNAWVKWNAGYRLPTEAELEKAARGSLVGKRFPWGDTITQSQGNYFSTNLYAYDVSSTRGFTPAYATGSVPYTSPVGAFAANGYGLRDLAGNVWEACWDWWDAAYYAASPGADPRGPDSGTARVLRGGSWKDTAEAARCSNRENFSPATSSNSIGFRCVRAP
jgi:formylglycine-generating enzyme